MSQSHWKEDYHRNYRDKTGGKRKFSHPDMYLSTVSPHSENRSFDNEFKYGLEIKSKLFQKASFDSLIIRFNESSFTYEHSTRVGEIAGILASNLRQEGLGSDFTENEVIIYYRDLGKYHDIGKYAIPFEILEKPGSLNKDEMNIIKVHPVIGEGMLRHNRELGRMLPAVRHHHERWDGKGYPDCLKGREIPLEARIVSIADAFDAIISNRPYRKGRSPRKAIEEILKNAGSQFDPYLARMFAGIAGSELGFAV